MMPTPKPLRVAFAACNKNAALYRQDPAFIYRCENLAHALVAQGHHVWQGHARRLPWYQQWDVVVVHRPRGQWWLQAMVAWLQRRGARCVADFDDLVFVPELAHHSPGVVNGLVPFSATQKQFSKHAHALQWFDAVTVSTQPLAEYAKSHTQGAAVHVVPNAVHWSWRSKSLPREGPDMHTMGYMPGTRSHDHDFAWLAPALERLLHAHPQVQLQITGPLNHGLDHWADRVAHQTKRPFAEYHQVFSGVGLNLAPLASSPFNDCKSGIKVMEAAWWGIPTVFSHLPDALRLQGAGGVHAASLAEFEDLLLAWAKSPSTFAPGPDALRQAVLRHADVFATASRWLVDVACGPAQEVACPG